MSSGKDKRKPALMVLVRVESTGEHSAPCRKAIRSAMVAYGVVSITVGMVC